MEIEIEISGYKFEGPFGDTSKLKDQPGVYTILDNMWTILDVGESNEVKTRVEKHDRKSCWKSNSDDIHFAVLYNPDENERLQIEKKIREEKKPPCGEK